jgi:hypothetical protein
MANRNPFEEYANKLRQAAARSGARGAFRGMPGGSPRGLGGAAATLMLLGGTAFVFNSCLFNVEGGHRAIKYRRISGVSKDIYGEGAQ